MPKSSPFKSTIFKTSISLSTFEEYLVTKTKRCSEFHVRTWVPCRTNKTQHASQEARLPDMPQFRACTQDLSPQLKKWLAIVTGTRGIWLASWR